MIDRCGSTISVSSAVSVGDSAACSTLLPEVSDKSVDSDRESDGTWVMESLQRVSLVAVFCQSVLSTFDFALRF